MTTITSTSARLLAAGCALTLTLTLAACGGGDGAGDPAGTTAGSAATTGGAPATSASTADDEADDHDADSDGSARNERWLSPLDEFLGFGVEPSAEEQAESQQLQRRMEQLVAECMTVQGFEYVARDPSVPAPSSEPWDLPAAEFAEQYGYGISTIDRDATASGDPNAVALEGMSVPEKQAYYQALYGDMITVDEHGGLEKRAVDSGASAEVDRESCSAQASTAVYGETTGPEADAGDDPFAPLQEEMSALYERVENDARVADARSGWAGCMADAGHPGLTDVYDASIEVSDRAGDVLGESMDPADADPAELEELRDYEIAVATADLACRRDYDAVRQAVQTEIEDAFIEEHRTELEQYRDAFAFGDAGVG